MGDEMNVVACGLGLNSVSMIIEMYNRGIPIDVILFADTGAEKPHTIAYKHILESWLSVRRLPMITSVRSSGKTLEQDCLDRKALPSIAYGFKSCSQRWKLQPQNKYMNNLSEAKEIWASGDRITKYIGYDYGESHRVKDYSDDKYEVVFPLVEWEIDRDGCKDIIRAEGLCLPGKSACFFCPSSSVAEIKELNAQYPELAERAIKMERNAELTQIKGLGRNYSWENVLRTDDMFEDNYIEISCGCYDG